MSEKFNAILPGTFYDLNLGIYNGFSYDWWNMPDQTQTFVYRFMRPKDDAYWQITDPDIVWQCTRDNAVDNVENYGFQFLNANKNIVQSALALIAVAVSTHL
jgi:hypothetical protein